MTRKSNLFFLVMVFSGLVSLSNCSWVQIKYSTGEIYKLAVEELQSADRLVRNGDYLQSVPHYREFIRLQPYEANGYRKLGLALYGLTRYQEAVSCFEEAIKLKPGPGESQDDLDATMALISTMPLHEKAARQLQRGDKLKDQGEISEAIIFYRVAIRIEPENITAYLKTYSIFSELSRYQELIDISKEALRSNPENVAAYLSLGLVYVAMGRWPEAANNLGQVIRLNPNIGLAHENLSKACLSLGYSRMAHEELYLAGLLYATEGNQEGLDRILETLRSQFPSSAFIADLSRRSKQFSSVPVAVSDPILVPIVEFENGSFEYWDSSRGGLSLPQQWAYHQDGKGGLVERNSSSELARDGQSSVFLKPSTTGNSFIRFESRSLQQLRGRNVWFSVWVKSLNKTSESIQVDIQDGTDQVVTGSYGNSGEWERISIKKSISTNADRVAVTCNIKADATSGAVFDEATLSVEGTVQDKVPLTVPLAKLFRGDDPILYKYTKVYLSPERIEVSSTHSPSYSAKSLADGNPETFWHVKHPPSTNQHWVLIDLGKTSRIEVIAILPRLRSPEQFWDRDHARLMGSNDKGEWRSIARLPVEKNTISKDKPDWLYYVLDKSVEYRYLQLSIGDNDFLSIAEIELYTTEKRGSQ